MSYLTEDEQKEKKREENRRMSRQQIIEHVKKSVMYTPFQVQWVPGTASFVAIGSYPNNNGALSVYELNKGELLAKTEARKPQMFKCLTFGHSGNEGRKFATGDFAGGLAFWDVERLDGNPISECAKAHNSIINGIDGALYDGPPEIVTGSRDGAVKLWDARQANKPVVALTPADADKARDCWTVKLGNSFAADERMIAAGYDNGDIKLYDLKMGKMRHEFNVSNGACDIEFDRADIEANKLIVSTLEGRIRAYDLRTLHPELGYAYVEDRVSSGTIWQSKALPQNREIFMTGGAGELTLCKYVYPPERSLRDGNNMLKGIPGTIEELNKVKIGDQPINSLDWNRSREGLLACCAFDQAVRVMLVTKLSLVQ